MDSLGAETFAVTGTSSGGMHALTLAGKYPDRVTALQLICCDANYAPGFPIAESGEFNSAVGTDGSVKYVDGSTTRPGGCMYMCCCYNPLCCFCACCPNGNLMDDAVEVKPVSYRLEDIKTPVQIIVGAKDDQVDPNTSKFHHSKLPNSTLDIEEEMGHCQV